MITSAPDRRELDLLPIERASTLSASWYRDPRVYALERERLWPATWQLVGHAGRIPAAGDYLVTEIAGHPLIVVRGSDGEVRTFYNVCRHRGGPLAWEDGHGKRLQCRYHGWVYSLEGRLERTREFEDVEGFDPACHGLIRVATVVLNGLIFACLSGKATTEIPASMAAIVERMQEDLITTKQFHTRVEYDVACNWKLFVDNYLEGYHLPFVHPSLAKTLSYRDYVTEIWDQCSLQTSRFSGGTGAYGDERGTVFYWFLYPNLMLNILPGRLQTNVVVPVAPDRCRVVFDYYYDDVSGKKATRRAASDMELSDRIQQEDIAVCEHAQKALASGAWSSGRFSVRQETGVYHFHALLRRDYSRLLDDEGDV